MNLLTGFKKEKGEGGGGGGGGVCVCACMRVCLLLFSWGGGGGWGCETAMKGIISTSYGQSIRFFQAAFANLKITTSIQAHLPDNHQAELLLASAKDKPQLKDKVVNTFDPC